LWPRHHAGVGVGGFFPKGSLIFSIMGAHGAVISAKLRVSLPFGICGNARPGQPWNSSFRPTDQLNWRSFQSGPCPAADHQERSVQAEPADQSGHRFLNPCSANYAGTTEFLELLPRIGGLVSCTRGRSSFSWREAAFLEPRPTAATFVAELAAN